MCSWAADLDNWITGHYGEDDPANEELCEHGNPVSGRHPCLECRMEAAEQRADARREEEI